jgi:transcription termination factor Rho
VVSHDARRLADGAAWRRAAPACLPRLRRVPAVQRGALPRLPSAKKDLVVNDKITRRAIMAFDVKGVLQVTEKGNGILRDISRSFKPSGSDAYVPHHLMKQCRLVEGAYIVGHGHKRKHATELHDITTIAGLTPEQFVNRPRFTQLTAVDPRERFNLGITGDVMMRIVDLLAPIGKGTRGMIVSPPKAGKTLLLEALANSIRACDPTARILVLLVDERPEEVTHFRRAVKAEVLARSNDQTYLEHCSLVELTLSHVRVELECGRNIVVLMDSLTRVARAFNVKGSGSGRTLTGGLEAGALEIPRRFFGLARNIENGGSVTIVATALVETGSRMDDMIFEEFKGTGNSEIVLDRRLADLRVFPALNITASGTRREERLYGPDAITKLHKLRRMLMEHTPDEAVLLMKNLCEKYRDNATLLNQLATRL